MSVENTAVKKAVALLDAVKAQYKIILEDGTEFGGLEVASKKSKTERLYKYGALTAYFEPLIKDLPVGGKMQIPEGDFDLDSIRRSVTGYCSRAWGNDTYLTSVNRKDGVVEVFRFM